ncbi:DSPc-domain-containing protein [Rhizopus microsporus var. microsporus]|uniref:protein-tyrosine-phosphatase n=1 Tax=Rhizopus microsporus var. microsporus TaxID=86635 RepID=A0A1X0R1N4_RHIZD|nr:DSPc-domain-containing protein [Rhizopus microsporus var. microsporus]
MTTAAATTTTTTTVPTSTATIATTTFKSASTSLSQRRKNKKNLSLCLPQTTLSTPIKTTDPYSNGPIEIMPHLYLGSEQNTLNMDQLRDTSTIHTNYSSDSLLHHPSDIIYHKLNWEHNQDNLVLELEKAIDIIDRSRSVNQNILVHCQCGVSRSATVIIAYIIKTLKLPMQDAYNHVKNLSPAVNPNLSLLFQLREFEQFTLKKKPHFLFSCSLTSKLLKK